MRKEARKGLSLPEDAPTVCVDGFCDGRWEPRFARFALALAVTDRHGQINSEFYRNLSSPTELRPSNCKFEPLPPDPLP